MFTLVEQNQLINENGSQDDQSDAYQPFDRHLPAPFEDILEQTIEGFNGFGP